MFYVTSDLTLELTGAPHEDFMEGDEVSVNDTLEKVSLPRKNVKQTFIYVINGIVR